jgi:hypothetical protein
MKNFNARELRAVAFVWSVPFCLLAWSSVAYAAEMHPVGRAMHLACHIARHIEHVLV